MDKIILSYILPCYNTGNFLNQCVESLLEQGLDQQEYEIICVNNAATDNTADILNKLSLSISNLKVVTLPVNKCSGGAYNAGLEVAKGKYVLFVDSDDYLKKGEISRLCKIMEVENLQMLQFNLIPFCDIDNALLKEKMTANSNFVVEIPVCNGEEYLKEATKQMNFLYLPVPAYRKIFLRTFLLDNSLFFTPTTIGTDFLHMMRCLIVVKRIKSICDKIYYYRYNPAGVSKVKVTKEKVRYALHNYSESYNCIKKSDLDASIKDSILKLIRATLQSYIGEIVDLSENDRIKLLKDLNNKPFLIEISRSFVQRLLFTNYKIYKLLHTVIYSKILKRM